MLKTKGDGSSQASHAVSKNADRPILDALLDALPCPVYYQNSAGDCIGCNQRFMDQLMDQSAPQFNDKTRIDIQSHLPSDLFEILNQDVDALLTRPGRRLYEADVRCKDGNNRRFAIHKSTIEDQSGNISGIVGLMLDITTSRNAEAELKRYSAELEKKVAQFTMSDNAASQQLSIEIERRRKAEKALQSSEDRYRSIFENTGTATILIEPDLTISMANVKAEKMAGIPREQFVGRSNAMDFVTPQHRDRLMLYHELRLKGDPNAPQQFEFQINDKNGATRDILANVQLVPETQQTVASLLDITEKNQLQKERQRLAAVIDQSAEAVIMTDKHGQVEYINQAFENLSGYDREDCIGKSLEADFFSKEDRQILKQMTFMVSGNDSWSGRVENKRRDSQTYIADTRIFPICDDRGNAINLVCVKTDVTHEVQLEKQLQHAQKMEAIGTLAGGIAHDFNNILGGILGYTEISMLKVGNDSQLKRNLDRILDGCRRAKELVQNILTFSRKTDEEIKPIEIQVIVKEALKLLRASIPSTVEFKQRIGTEPSIVCATPTQVHQVIMNLCTNASHAMHKNGGVLEVILENTELTSDQCKGKRNLSPGAYCRLAVCDTGEGMDPKILDRIFEPYFTTKEQTGGTGLGLSMVHGIVKNFGGAILVESQRGKGTTFDIYLPRIEDTLDAQAPAKEALPSGQERILVADDELFILEIMTDMLSSLGYAVETVNGGPEAIEKFSSAPEDYDVVIADLTMPKLTGTQLALKIKQLRDDVPIILTTGMTFDAKIGQDQFKEFAAVLNKPILYQELAKTLRTVLDKPEPT